MKLFKLIIIIFLTFTSTVFSQSEKNVTETERIVDKYGGQIIEGFNTVIERVTPMAEEGFKAVVAVQIAKGIGEFLIGGSLILCIIFILYWQKRAARDEWEEDNAIPTYIFGGIIQIVSFIVAMNFFYDGILYLYAPEWFAIKDILELVIK